MAVAAVAVVSALFAAYSQVEAGKNAKDIANRNAAALNQTAQDNLDIAVENIGVTNRAALAIEEQGQRAVELKRKEISRLLAYQRSQEAVSGFMYEGTPLAVAVQSAKEGDEDVATIWANAVTEARATRDKGRIIGLQGQRVAGQLQTQADITAKQGQYAESSGQYSGASTLLQGVSNAYTISKYPQLTAQRMRIG